MIRVARRGTAALVALVGLAVFSCRSARPGPAPRGAPTTGPGQFLFRAELDVGGERGTLRLTLRRWSDVRFDLTARDLAGRALWRLEVDRGFGRLEGRDRSEHCRFDPTIPLALPRLALPLSADSLPDLLLGELPARGRVPADGPEVRFRDERGRLWQAERRGDVVSAWRLMLAPDASDLVWRREPRGFRLESADGELVVSWRESARAALVVEPTNLEVDPLLAECRDLDLP